MHYQRYKTENGAQDSIPDSHGLFIRKIKRYFIFGFFSVSLIIGLGIAKMGNIEKNASTYIHSALYSFIYRAEFANYGDISGATTAFADRPAGSVNVLVYHGITDYDDGSGIAVSTENFKKQMFALKKAGYETVTTEELYKFLRGDIELPEKSFMISFDDGRFDSYYNADPVLKALGYESVMFIISNASLPEGKARSYYVLTSDLKNMNDSGRWDIQAHTHDGHDIYPIDAEGHTSPFFGSKLWLRGEARHETDDEFRTRVADDMSTVKKLLGETLRKDIIGFAFPMGDYGQQPHVNDKGRPDIVIEEADKLYRVLFFQEAPGIRYSSNFFTHDRSGRNTYMARRMDAIPEWTGEEIVAVMEKTSSKMLPFADDFSKDRGWIQSWGNLMINSDSDGNNYIVLNSGFENSDSGAATILEGTLPWKDYLLRTVMNVPNRNSAFAWVRFQDDNNNAACNLGEGFVHVEQTVNGEHRVIKGLRSPDIRVPEGDFNFDVRVRGRKVSCIVNGRPLVETDFLDPLLSTGGIGFKTWDDTPGRGLLIVKSVRVDPLQ